MKPSEIISRLKQLSQTQNWSTDSFTFFIDFFIEMPYPELIRGFTTSINISGNPHNPTSNITIIDFELAAPEIGSQKIQSNISDYLEQFLGEDTIDSTWANNLLIIQFQY